MITIRCQHCPAVLDGLAEYDAHARADHDRPRGMQWEYDDARGVTHRGIVATVNDYGGTDVSHAMQSGCGAYVMLSGARLRAARTLNTSVPSLCPHERPDR